MNGREFPRLQLRGSAGFAPASHGSGERPCHDLRKPKIEKEQNYSFANLAGGGWDVNAWSAAQRQNLSSVAKAVCSFAPSGLAEAAPVPALAYLAACPTAPRPT